MFQTQKVTKQMKNPANSPFLLFFFYLIFLFIFIIFSRNSFAQIDKETTEITELPNAGILTFGSYSLKTEFYPSGSLRFSFNFVPFKDAILSLRTYLIDLENFSTKFPAIVYFKYRLFNERIPTPAVAAGFTTHSFASQHSNYLPYYDFAPGVFFITSKAFENFLGISDLHFGFNYSLYIEKTKGAMLLYIGFSQQIIKYFRASFEGSKVLDKGYSSAILLNFSLDFSIPCNFKIGIVLRDFLNNYNLNNSFNKYLTIEYKLK